MRQNLNRAFNRQIPPTDHELDRFVLAARFGNNNDVSTFLDKYPDAIDKSPIISYIATTALISAVVGGQKDTIKLLLKRGASVEAASQGGTPLVHAAERGNVDIIELLLQHGARVNVNPKESRAPLAEAIARLNVEAVKLLLARDASLESRNSDGQTPFVALQEHIKGIQRVAKRAEQILQFREDAGIRASLNDTPLRLEKARQIEALLQQKINTPKPGRPNNPAPRQKL